MMSPTSALLLPAVHVSPSPGAPPHDDVSSSSECSSVGSASSDGEEESSEAGKDAGVTSSLGSLGSLEDSLPIKKGLSSHFVGKSRSFSNLTECESGDAVDLAKVENPFNKRRRIQIASRISYRRRRASCSSLVMVPLPPLLSPEHALPEETEEEEEDDDHDSNGGRIIVAGNGRFPLLAPAPPGGKLIFDDKIKIMGAKGATNVKAGTILGWVLNYQVITASETAVST